MSEPSEDSPRSSQERGPVRFEATVHPTAEGVDLARVADLDLDRVPDPVGGIRVIVDVDDCRRLLESGFEVRLQRALPVRPLDPRLVPGDDDVRARFEARLRGAGAD
jgi:hypothetical protein